MQPNLILLTVECWRADHFGTLTPNLMQLGQESSVFSGAQASGGWTRISMTALMSSAYASMHGGPSVALAAPSRRVLAECLLEKGYWTAGFTANPSCGSSAGFHRGFGHYWDARRKPALPPEAPSDWETQWEQLLAMGISPRETHALVDARALTNAGLRWLSERKPGEPYFLWLHYLDPHWPCQMAHGPATPEELRNAWHDVRIYKERVIPSGGRFDPGPEASARWALRYRESLSHTDLEIGRLLSELRARPDWNQTIVAVTGDHGEELYERGRWHHSWNQLHPEGINVPLIIRVPGNPPTTLNDPVGLLDLAPTLLDYAGVAQPASMIGRSLRPMVEAHLPSTRPVFSEMMGHRDSLVYRLAIRDGEWKYIYDFEDPHHSTLFRVSDDPNERHDLRDQYPEVFRRFERMRLAHVTLGLTSQMARAPRGKQCAGPVDAAGRGRLAAAGGIDASEDPTLREQLVALGYL